MKPARCFSVRFLTKALLLVLITSLLTSCASSRYKKLQKNVQSILEAREFENHFTGLLIYDPEKRDTLFNQNGDKYFTPASNVKIFTLYAGLRLLPDRLPALRYLRQNDTLFIEGTGDPSLLHPYFQDSTVIKFIRQAGKVRLNLNNFYDTHWGPGWAWEDFDSQFSPERSPFPIYGNVVQLSNSGSGLVNPAYFRDKIHYLRYTSLREREANVFYLDPDSRDTVLVPFKIDSTLTRQLLENASGSKIGLVESLPPGEKEILWGMPADSIYQEMMHESDNFLAEQILLMASAVLGDTLNTSVVREMVLDSLLPDMKQPPRWVDGSGLSRYNLFSPESMVSVLVELYGSLPESRLFRLFPAGGVSGTLQDWYPGNTAPYIFAKTGSLGNNHCLSGYLRCASGKILVFSFMNNHYIQPTSAVKERIQRLLEWVRDNN